MYHSTDYQSWKKLHALHAMRADILPRITHFWGHFGPKIPHFCRNFEAGIEDRQLIEDEDWGWWLGLGLKIEDQGLRVEEVLRMRIEDGSKITHFCRNSCTFEDISEPSKCPCADILSFFPALIIHTLMPLSVLTLHTIISLGEFLLFRICH